MHVLQEFHDSMQQDDIAVLFLTSVNSCPLCIHVSTQSIIFVTSMVNKISSSKQYLGMTHRKLQARDICLALFAKEVH